MTKWKEIAILNEKYEVSSDGDIRNKKTGRILKQQITEFGYKIVTISHKTYRVHRLVAEAFVPNLDNKPQINHINGDKTDNRIINLEWMDNSENVSHCYKNIRECGSSSTPKPIVCVETGVIYESISSAARKFGVCVRAIQRSINQEKYTSCGYHWKFI